MAAYSFVKAVVYDFPMSHQAEQTYSPSSQVTDVSGHAPLANEDAVILGTNVGRLREEAGLNMSRFAAYANISRPFLYDIESGIANPKLTDMQKIARALGVHVIDLLMPPGERR